jgi:hypothetical protein
MTVGAARPSIHLLARGSAIKVREELHGCLTAAPLGDFQ